MLELKIGAAEKRMGWMEFVASLVGSLAWPVAAVIIAAIFHKQIAALLAKIRKLNWGDASVELSEQLDKVEDRASRSKRRLRSLLCQLQRKQDPMIGFKPFSRSHLVPRSWMPGSRSSAAL